MEPVGVVDVTDVFAGEDPNLFVMIGHGGSTLWIDVRPHVGVIPTNRHIDMAVWNAIKRQRGGGNINSTFILDHCTHLHARLGRELVSALEVFAGRRPGHLAGFVHASTSRNIPPADASAPPDGTSTPPDSPPCSDEHPP